MAQTKFRGSEKTKARKKKFLDFLQGSLGNVSIACKKANINRGTHYLWLQQDEVYREAIEEIKEEATDFVEDKLFKKINEGDTTSIIFYLKSKGKHRGWTERQEVQHSTTTSADDLKEIWDEVMNQEEE